MLYRILLILFIIFIAVQINFIVKTKNDNEEYDNITINENIEEESSNISEEVIDNNSEKILDNKTKLYDNVSKKYVPYNKDELIELIHDENIYLGDIDVSNITDMSFLFKNSKRKSFKGIDLWDVSNVFNMEEMFYKAEYFNENIENWNVSNVENMYCMFNGAKSFNQPLNKWNTMYVEDISCMFEDAVSFNQPLNNWNTSNVKEMNYVFADA